MSILPWWDPGAFPQVTTVGPNGQQGTGTQPAPGIWTLIPETPSQAWPDQLSPWDCIYFSGQRAPGIARVDGGRRRRIDHRQSPGASGETAANMGYDPGEFTITLTIWTSMQWAALQQLMSTIQPPPTAKVQPKAVKVQHPALNVLNIYDVYIEGIELPKHIGKQVFEIVIDAVEFLLPENEGNAKIPYSVDQLPNGKYVVRTVPADPSTTSTGP